MIAGEVVVVLAHELHEVAVEAQDDEHLQPLVVEQRVAVGEHVVGAAASARARRTTRH